MKSFINLYRDDMEIVWLYSRIMLTMAMRIRLRIGTTVASSEHRTDTTTMMSTRSPGNSNESGISVKMARCAEMDQPTSRPIAHCRPAPP